MTLHLAYPRCRSLSRFIARGLIVVAMYLIGGAKLEASCGDYLHVGGSQTHVNHGVGMHNMTPSSKDAPLPFARCPSGKCEQHIPLPANPPAPVDTSDWEKSAVKLSNLEFAIYLSTQQAIEAGGQPSAGFPYRLKRPPRA